MKDFKNLIGASEKDVKNIRIQNCVNAVSDESKMEVMNKRKEYRNLQLKLENLLDLGSDTTTDLATNLKNINATKFTKDLYEICEEMLIIARQLKMRIKVHNTLFPDSKEQELDETELDFIKDLI